jgi:hypothetical protein
MTAGLRFEILSGVEDSLFADAVVPIGLATWADPFRFGASTGLGTGSCGFELCGEERNEAGERTTTSGPVLPLEARVDYLFAASSNACRPVGSVRAARGVGARCEGRATSPDSRASRRPALAADPAGSPRRMADRGYEPGHRIPDKVST